jgi:hypothetical protein
MSLIKRHFKRLARALYRKSVTRENGLIQELGHSDPTSAYPIPACKIIRREISLQVTRIFKAFQSLQDAGGHIDRSLLNIMVERR